MDVYLKGNIKNKKKPKPNPKQHILGIFPPDFANIFNVDLLKSISECPFEIS